MANQRCDYMYFLRMVIYTGEEHYTKSVHTGDEPHIHDIIVESFIKTPVYKTYPCRIH